MSDTPEKKNEVETTGHTWDGDLEEYNNPLPRWWLWTFYVTCIWGLIYTIAYPAWPMLVTATPGVLKYSSRVVLQQELDNAEAANAVIEQQLAAVDATKLPETPELQQYAFNKGAAIFRNNCSQCHGSGAAGATGYPNLLDDDWLWGGSIDDIIYTVRHGIRNEQSPDTHWSQMPAFGEILPENEIDEVVQYVRSISGQEHDEALAEKGQQIYLDQCAACHMEDGTGDRFQGAPNLTDAIWLYGGDTDALTSTVTHSRFGVMPAWSEEYRPAQGLNEAEIKAVSAYVHQLGGGE